MDHRKQFLHDVDAVAHWVNIPQEIAQRSFCRDADDDKFIHAALTSKADLLVTGDLDLLVLSAGLLPLGVRILSPADALQQPKFG